MGRAGQHVQEQVDVIVDVEGGRAEEVGGFAPVLQRAVVEVLVAAAVVAGSAVVVGRITGTRRIEDRTLVQVGQAVAGGLARIEIIPVDVLANERMAGHDAAARAVQARIGEAALVVPDRLGLVEFQAEYRVEPALRKAAAYLEPLRTAAAVLGVADAVIDGGAVGLLLQDEVDHARHRVGTVDRGGAAAQDFHAVDQRGRQVGDVGEIAVAVVGLRVVGDAPAVDQHQRVVGAESAQVDGLRAGRETVGALVVVERTEVLGERGHHVRHVGETVPGDVLGGDRGDRRGPFDLRTRNARAGHHDRLQLGRRCLVGTVVCRRRRRCGPGRRRYIGAIAPDDHHRAGDIVMDGVTAAIEQSLQGLVGRQRAADPARAQAAQLIRLIDELRAGLPGQAVERRDEIPGGNADGPNRVGLRVSSDG